MTEMDDIRVILPWEGEPQAMKFRVELTNYEGWRLQVVVQAVHDKDACETAAAEVNHPDSEHSKYGPWVAGRDIPIRDL